MLKLLTKLATLLDNKGNHTLAEEIDRLALKIAQETKDELYGGEPEKLTEDDYVAVPFGDFKNTQLIINDIYNELLDIYTKVHNQSQGGTGLDPKQLVNELFPQFNKIVSKINEQKIQLPQPSWDQLQKTIANQFASIQMSNQPEKMPAMFDEAAKDLEWLLTELKPIKQKTVEKDMPNKMPAKHKTKNNPLISKIEELLGLKPTGIWNITLNNVFISYMKRLHAASMKGSRFLGTLTDAYNLMLNDKAKPLSKIKEDDNTELSKLPQQEDKPKWSSKIWNVSTPAAQKALSRLDQAQKNEGRGEDGQEMINNLETQALRRNPKNPLAYIDQALFEEMLAQKTVG